MNNHSLVVEIFYFQNIFKFVFLAIIVIFILFASILVLYIFLCNFFYDFNFEIFKIYKKMDFKINYYFLIIY